MTMFIRPRESEWADARQMLGEVARDVGVTATEVRFTGRGIMLRLKPQQGSPLYRVRDRSRPVLCRHGHEAFIEAYLEQAPDAEIETLITTYLGLDDFDKRQDDLYDEIRSLTAGQECWCESW